MMHAAFEKLQRDLPEQPVDYTSLDAQQFRASYREGALAIRGEMAPMAEITSTSLPLVGRQLGARLFVPEVDEHLALVIYFHGGGWVVGDAETHEGVCRRLALDTKMRFLSVEYRLAPEFPYPAALDDAIEAVRYVATNLEDFADPGTPLIVMGDSAGATLATLAATALRDEVPLVAQALIYPVMGPEIVTDSKHHYGRGYFLDTDEMDWYFRQYLGPQPDTSDPRISLLMSSDLARVAPAIVVVAEFDPLRDEGVAYAGLLEHFGVPVEVLEAKGMVHGFIRYGAQIPDALEIVDAIARHLHRYVETARRAN